MGLRQYQYNIKWTDKKERTPNSTYNKLAVQWLNEALCFVSSFVVAGPPRRMLRNCQLLLAANRYATPQRNRTKPNQKPKTNNQICEIQNDDLYLTNDVK